jgi:diketogulonate reductase-like aldo/keto reductase
LRSKDAFGKDFYSQRWKQNSNNRIRSWVLSLILSLKPKLRLPSSAFYTQDVTKPGIQALETGFTHLDSAQIYDNEASLGKAITSFDRSKLFITTKLGQIPQGQSIRDTLVRSCKELQVDYVDLFLIHSPKLIGLFTISEAWAQLEELQKEGLAKSIGVSNFPINDLEELLSNAKVVPSVNQVNT